MVLFTQIIKSAEFNGAIEIYLLGLPIIIVILYTRDDGMNLILMTSELRLPNPETCQRKNAYYQSIVDAKDTSRSAAILLKGYVNHHTLVCPYSTCPIKAYKRLMEEEHKKQNMLERRRNM